MAGVDEAEHVPGVFTKLPFLICTQYTSPVAWSVISIPFVTDIELVLTSVNIAKVAVIWFTAQLPADWMRFATAEAIIPMND
jgi:hypothetical protein